MRTQTPAFATTDRAKTTTLTGSWSGPTTGLTRPRIFYEVEFSFLVPQLKLLMSSAASPWRYCSIKPDRADCEVPRGKSQQSMILLPLKPIYRFYSFRMTRLGPRFTGRMLPVNHRPWCMIHIWMWTVLTPDSLHAWKTTRGHEHLFWAWKKNKKKPNK